MILVWTWARRGRHASGFVVNLRRRPRGARLLVGRDQLTLDRSAPDIVERPFGEEVMRSILTALAVGLFAIAGLVPTGTPALAAGAAAPADGKVIVSCGWSDAGDCPFNAV